MSTKKATKRALLTSILAICLCLVMLIGSTFAWFTDTASTSVNSIQSGTLKVALEMQDAEGNWVDAENQTLNFLRAKGENETEVATDILWEPGCTYELQPVRVRNDGNLALKYKVEITGIDANRTPVSGEFNLNDVIEWTIVTGDDDNNAAVDKDNHVLPGEYFLLPADTVSAPLTIKGHMKEEAGNDYQGLSIENVAITVYATQYTYESDSNDKWYDANAQYPEAISNVADQYGNDGVNMPESVAIVGNDDGTFDITLEDEEAFIYFTQVFNRAAAFEARKAAWGTEGFIKYPYEYNSADLNMWYGSYCNRITVKMGCDVDLNNIIVTPFGFGGYEFYFDGEGHTIKNAKVMASTGDAGFFGARVNISDVTLENINVFATGCNSAAVVSGAPNSTITGVTVKNSSVTGGKYTGAIAGYDYGDITDCTVIDTVVSGQYKVGGIVGYTCTDNAEQQRQITGNTLTGVTVKGENLWADKNHFVIGKIVGNWNAITGTCNNNAFDGTTTATDDIGETEAGCTANK